MYLKDWSQDFIFNKLTVTTSKYLDYILADTCGFLLAIHLLMLMCGHDIAGVSFH